MYGLWTRRAVGRSSVPPIWFVTKETSSVWGKGLLRTCYWGTLTELLMSQEDPIYNVGAATSTSNIHCIFTSSEYPTYSYILNNYPEILL